MIQLTISVLAWMGVIVFQFMVHYVCSGRRSVRNDDEETMKEVAYLQYDWAPPQYPLVINDLEQPQATTTEITTRDRTASNTSSTNSTDYPFDTPVFSESRKYNVSSDDLSLLDEDVEEHFFRLLDQTGSEMVKNCCSMKDLVDQQINRIDYLV